MHWYNVAIVWAIFGVLGLICGLCYWIVKRASK